MSDLRRRLRGMIRNAVVWGIGWTMLGLAATLAMRMTGIVDASVSVLGAAGIGLKIGVGGAIAGATFSAFIAFAYCARRIQDISWVKFGLGGAVVTTLSITGFVQGASLLGGSGLVPWRYLNPTLGMFAVFGFSVAAMSMKFAQLATSQSRDSEEILIDDERSVELGSGDGVVSLQQRTRAEVEARHLPLK